MTQIPTQISLFPYQKRKKLNKPSFVVEDVTTVLSLDNANSFLRISFVPQIEVQVKCITMHSLYLVDEVQFVTTSKNFKIIDQ